MGLGDEVDLGMIEVTFVHYLTGDVTICDGGVRPMYMPPKRVIVIFLLPVNCEWCPLRLSESLECPLPTAAELCRPIRSTGPPLSYLHKRPAAYAQRTRWNPLEKREKPL